MKKRLSTCSFLLIGIIGLLFASISSAIAEECRIDTTELETNTPTLLDTSQREHPPHEYKAVIYAEGNCREACKSWSQDDFFNSDQPDDTANQKSYQYVAWDAGLRKCIITNKRNNRCPQVGAGTVECNY